MITIFKRKEFARWQAGEKLTDAALCQAVQEMEKGLIDAVAFGRDFIANPDLVARLQQGALLNPQRPETFYGGGAEGYTDYPFMK